MRIEVTGSGSVTHGLSGVEHLVIPPGVYDTNDPSCLVSEELAALLVANTNGHVIEYKPKSTAKAAVITVEKTPGQQNKDALEAAQTAQASRLAQAKEDRAKEDAAEGKSKKNGKKEE